MEIPRSLDDLDTEEIRNFLDSFDTIITDCDGVLWLGPTPIKGSFEILKRLQELGKKIIFVSNNSTQTVDVLCEKLKKMGYAASTDQIAIPSSAICWYLKKVKFNGKAFVLGTQTFRQVLKDQGIDVGEPGPYVLEESPEAVLLHIRNAPKVDAVIVDFDININWAKITRAIEYLKDPETLYLTGALDRKILMSAHLSFLGIPDFVDTISKESNRQPIECAKPSEVLKDYVIEMFGIVDPARCIFIGDSLESDMKFADLCGFGKLWVGSGVNTLDESKSVQRSVEECDSSLPFYYLPSLGHLSPLLDKSTPLEKTC